MEIEFDAEEHEDDWIVQTLREITTSEDFDVDENIDFDELVESAVKEWADPMYSTVRNDQTRLDHWLGKKTGFERRLYTEWKDGFDLFELFIAFTLENGDEINRSTRDTAVEQQDYVFEALTRLHARACKISQEIFSLIESGFADGADARWRGLHEVAATAHFIRNHGNETAERFLLYSTIEEYYEAKAYREHDDVIGERVPDERFEELKEMRQELINRFGDNYDNPYGWAYNVVDGGRIGFKQIEKDAGLAHYRPYYKMASDNVHGGSRGTTVSLSDIPDSNTDFMVAGKSNTGFTRPAHLTAISLNQVTSTLIAEYPSPKRVLNLYVLKRFARDISNEFYETQSDIEEREMQYREEFENQMEDIAEQLDYDI